MNASLLFLKLEQICIKMLFFKYLENALINVFFFGFHHINQGKKCYNFVYLDEFVASMVKKLTIVLTSFWTSYIWNQSVNIYKRCSHYKIWAYLWIISYIKIRIFRKILFANQPYNIRCASSSVICFFILIKLCTLVV